MKSKTALDIISFLFILLFIYTAVSKLIDFNQFQRQMYNQTLPHDVATLLIWTLPEIEILTGLLLLFEKTKPYGFYLSFTLMLLFTGYITLVLLNYFGRVPCSCGGVIKALGWKWHLIFNLFFLLLSSLAITITNRERRLVAKQD
jgi:putative oxidoreductase